eukprot:97995-Hanusia_phi.AAC.2
MIILIVTTESRKFFLSSGSTPRMLTNISEVVACWDRFRCKGVADTEYTEPTAMMEILPNYEFHSNDVAAIQQGGTEHALAEETKTPPEGELQTVDEIGAECVPELAEHRQEHLSRERDEDQAFEGMAEMVEPTDRRQGLACVGVVLTGMKGKRPWKTRRRERRRQRGRRERKKPWSSWWRNRRFGGRQSTI